MMSVISGASETWPKLRIPGLEKIYILEQTDLVLQFASARKIKDFADRVGLHGHAFHPICKFYPVPFQPLCFYFKLKNPSTLEQLTSKLILLIGEARSREMVEGKSGIS